METFPYLLTRACSVYVEIQGSRISRPSFVFHYRDHLLHYIELISVTIKWRLRKHLNTVNLQHGWSAFFLPKYLMILTGCIGVADNWKWFDSGGKCIRHVWTGGCTIAHPTWIIWGVNQRVVWFPIPLAAGIFPSQDLPSEAHKLHTNTKTKTLNPN